MPRRHSADQRCDKAAARISRILAWGLLSAVAACSTPAPPIVKPVGDGAVVSVRLTNFAFDPDNFQLTAGKPVRLRLINDSDGGHDFSAPTLFAASDIMPGAAVPGNGDVEVGSHETIEIMLTPRTPGKYPVECTHFLHALFGMSATVAVVP